MNVVLRWQGDEYEIDVAVVDPSATVGQLVSSLVGEGDHEVAVDGQTLAPSIPTAEVDLRDGSVVEVGAATDPRLLGSLVDVTAGTAGTVYPLMPGVVSIGPAPADVVIDGAPGRLILSVETSGGMSLRNPDRIPARVDGREVTPAGVAVAHRARIAIGPCELSVVVPGVAPPTVPAVFNRPPRSVYLYRPTELEPPAPPQQTREAMRFGWGALIVPVILGIGMALLIHPRMAAFALFSPAMLLANWLEDKRRVRRECREAGEAFAMALNRFRGEVAVAHRAATEHCHRGVLRPGDLERCARFGDSHLWERRLHHDDFMVVPVGTGCRPWDASLVGPLSPRTSRIMSRFAELHDVPMPIELSPGDVTGVAGDRELALGVARQLVLQAAVHHGPADLTISVFTDWPAQWDWLKWLPHVRVDAAGRRRLAGTPDEIAAVVALLPVDPEDAQRHLLIVDLPDLASGPRALIREVIRSGKKRGIAGIAVARRALDLPSTATTIVSLEAPQGRIRYPDGTGIALSPWALGAASARRSARALARIQDPEAVTSAAGLPGIVHLDSLLGLGVDAARSIESNWRSNEGCLPVPIGVDRDGELYVDLVADGPHALLGGTTGAGKSELLRTLVASLAASVSPTALNFVLVDYKGGSAFDACAALPHTVGLVTDLDEHLARRALICLDAELRYREERLRSAGVSDIESFPETPANPLPRLLVLIDEFAALAKELPDFIDALVGVAQRGRSLGVHLFLATQRPNGVISDTIKANTNLRIALRVQDVADSVDVIGSAEAAAIGRTQPGQGLARRGPGDVVAFQTALVTGRSRSGETPHTAARPFGFSHEQAAASSGTAPEPSGPTDLEVIVAAACAVASKGGLVPVHSPWPEPLPDTICLDELPRENCNCNAATFGVGDEPHRQRRTTVEWSPATGNLLLYGLPGSGTTTALATLASSIAGYSSPDDTQMYVLDFDDQLLHPLSDLPHVGAVVGGHDRERQLRLLRRLAAELHERRLAMCGDGAAGADYPIVVTMLDNYGAFADSYADPGDMSVHNLVARLVADGPGVGMMTIITAKHAGDVPTRVASLVASRLVFRLADRYDYSGLGVPPVDPPTTPGRAFEAGTGREVQVALSHGDGLAAAVAANPWPAPIAAPWSIDVLPPDVPIAEFISVASISPDEWFLPLGIGDSSLAPVGLVLRDGDHALITGPPRSGKTTALATIATVAKAASPDVYVAAVLPRRSPLSRCAAVDRFINVDDLATAEPAGRSWLLLIDDAELVDAGSVLRNWMNDRNLKVRVVASGAAEAIRGLYGHWTQDLRRSRIGCALRPNTVTDGDLWHTQLPRRPQQPFPVGRGYLLADGQAELVQLGRS